MAKSVVVVGAGLGGISAAISLAQAGYRVEVFEKNAQIGGKLNVLSEQGYTFDLGPSILTMPHIFERLFERSGKRMAEYFEIVPVRPHWRCIFADGKTIDLDPDPAVMAEQAAKAGEQPGRIEAFLRYCKRMYEFVDHGYFENGPDTLGEVMAQVSPLKMPWPDLFRSMHAGVAKHLTSPYLRDIFDFFIKYVGSSAYDAPGFMNVLPAVQFEHDLWYVRGGLYNIARGMRAFMDELDIAINLKADVTAIRREGRRVKGITVAGRGEVDADIVVSNMEVIPAYRDLVGEDDEFVAKLEKRFAPTCSGIVLDLGLDRRYEQLAHHNCLFSGNQREHFDTVFRKHQLPDDPTIYLVAASRSDPTVAPDGCDALKILPHIPPIDPQRPLSEADYLAFKDRIIDKLERMGLTDLRKHIVFEHVWTPLDIERMYRSNRGSIYGVITDRKRNMAFKAPKQSTRYPNLFFVGGSVNPGGGMPMVVLCGQHVARKIVAWDQIR